MTPSAPINFSSPTCLNPMGGGTRVTISRVFATLNVGVFMALTNFFVPTRGEPNV